MTLQLLERVTIALVAVLFVAALDEYDMQRTAASQRQFASA
jgi:hypothetical protein